MSGWIEEFSEEHKKQLFETRKKIPFIWKLPIYKNLPKSKPIIIPSKIISKKLSKTWEMNQIHIITANVQPNSSKSNHINWLNYGR
jgi:hypothetical protein